MALENLKHIVMKRQKCIWHLKTLLTLMSVLYDDVQMDHQTARNTKVLIFFLDPIRVFIVFIIQYSKSHYKGMKKMIHFWHLLTNFKRKYTIYRTYIICFGRLWYCFLLFISSSILLQISLSNKYCKLNSRLLIESFSLSFLEQKTLNDCILSGVARSFKWGGGGQSVEGRENREIFENLCIKITFLAH